MVKPGGTLYTAGYNKKYDLETGQVEAYEVAARELGLRVFITNERGEVFTPDLDRSSGWIRCDRQAYQGRGRVIGAAGGLAAAMCADLADSARVPHGLASRVETNLLIESGDSLEPRW